MKTNRNALVAVALCSVLFTVPLAFSLGLIEIPGFTAENASFMESSSSNATVFFWPDKIVKDYLLDPGYQIGDAFQIHVNITDVTDLYTWNVNLTWNATILNFTRIVEYGDVLAQTSSPHGTSRIVNIVNADNETGYAVTAESVLGNYSGVSTSGRLLTIEFLIVGYGWSDLNFSSTGIAPTILLNSTGGAISYNSVSGYFSNKIRGDVDGDGDVDRYDFGAFALAYGSRCGEPNYDPNCDFDGDCDVDRYDFGILAQNYGQTI